jgi:hypothetical protein
LFAYDSLQDTLELIPFAEPIVVPQPEPAPVAMPSGPVVPTPAPSKRPFIMWRNGKPISGGARSVMRKAILRVSPASAKFHRLTLLDFGVNGRTRIAKVKCMCGRIRRVRFHFVRSGHCKSCGCLRGDQARAQINLNRPTVSPTFKHGGTSDPKLIPLYRVYRRMLARCLNPNADGHKNWGGRGIKVAKCWRGPNGFTNWMKSRGPRPKGFWIDRKNNDASYPPRNCRWADSKTQRANQRRNNGRCGVITNGKE